MSPSSDDDFGIDTSPDTVEISTECFDPDLQGIGSSPWVGDFVSSAIQVPTPPSTPNNRYEFVLASAVLMPGETGVVRGIRTRASLRAIQTAGRDSFPVEIEITDPLFKFVDGNICWRLEVLSGAPLSENGNQNATMGPGISTDNYETSPSLLQTPGIGYVPPGAGIFPGSGIASLGVWRDMRFPWNQQGTGNNLKIKVYGPATIRLVCSVKQTDPVNRLVLPVLPAGAYAWAKKEDLFVDAFPSGASGSRYGSVSGSLIISKGHWGGTPTPCRKVDGEPSLVRGKP